MVLVTSLKVIEEKSGVSVLKICRNKILIKAIATASKFKIKILMTGLLCVGLFLFASKVIYPAGL